MALAKPADFDELFDLEYIARGPGSIADEDVVQSGTVVDHPSVRRTLMSVDEKLYQIAGEALEAPAYENLSLPAADDTDAGVDRWDY